MMRVLRILAVLAVTALIPAARAELFRCTGPDGKPVYTDQKHTCPGSDPSEPTGVVHRAATPEAAGTGSDRASDPKIAPAARTSEPRPADDAQQAAFWKQKKRDAEHELARLSERRASYDLFADHCSRPGKRVITRDDAGIKQYASCSEVIEQFHALEKQEAAARDYLATGLPEECRRAGCLPGWVR
jgi:hypothetical protein